jgi:hypothetical protein
LVTPNRWKRLTEKERFQMQEVTLTYITLIAVQTSLRAVGDHESKIRVTLPLQSPQFTLSRIGMFIFAPETLQYSIAFYRVVFGSVMPETEYHQHNL